MAIYFEQNRQLLDDFWIVADEAYKCTEFLMKNFAKNLCGDDESAFNSFLSQLRNQVEQVFGILTA